MLCDASTVLLFLNYLINRFNDALVLKCYSAIYTAISRWEDRISISQIYMSSVKGNGLVFDIEGFSQITGQQMNLRIPLNMGAGA